MNDQAHKFFIIVDANEPNIFVDKRLSDLFPDGRSCVVMPREKWPSYKNMNLGKAEISLNLTDRKILVSGFDLEGNFKTEQPIELRADQPENMRFQIQYALGQLGALTLSNGKCSSSKKPTLNL